MPGLPFPELPGSADLPAIEHEILRRWADGKVFQRSLEQTAGGPRWIFYEGPPTANGMPGVHHIEARVFKDAFPRFKTMQGYHVPRRAGWDCHGLPVEVAVEKELGLTAKRDIEAYGIAAFNARCRESVLRHVDAFAELTRRMGYWIDLSTAYRTMDPAYIESVWWSLQQVYRAGLLVRDYRISPYCPRCGTPLSDHEMGQPDVYRTVTDPSVIVRFPLRELPPGGRAELRGADLLVWTTTPWTLVSNTAVAVHPGELYAVARRSGHGDRVVVADNLVARVLGEGWHVITRMRGSELAGATYQPPFSLVEITGAHRVITAPFVTTADGTGLVHLAPAFGADDLAAGREHGLPVVNPVQPDGRFEARLPLIGGMFFKAANRPLISDLGDRGLLFRSAGHEHSYPHCWRCGTALLYYAMPSWFIRTTAIKDQLLAQNEQTNWQPPSIRDGRYGEWLRSNVDWALSRTRYWGTPLPLWQCPSGHVTCVGSLAELSELAGAELSGLDPHRPFVDDVVFGCPDCHEQARRVPEVIDVWYDSGSMPFAQFGAPLRGEAEFRQSYPAQFICEAIDQTRGWFYSLMAVGTLVFGQSAYENVVCLGLIADERGRKMSKHLGNVLEPLPLLEAHGADAVRWFFFAAGSPWATRKIGTAALEEIVRKVLLTYWNTVSFLVRYANAGAARGAAWTPRLLADAPPPAQRPPLDRWLLSELNAVVRDATAALESFDSAAAGRRIAAFIDDLSNWYVRRSRRRFWDGPGTPAGAAAFATLYTAAETVTRLMAPVTPFLTDYLWGVLHPAGAGSAGGAKGAGGTAGAGSADGAKGAESTAGGGSAGGAEGAGGSGAAGQPGGPDLAPESVHLARWPAADADLIDEDLANQMALARRLVELGRAARASAALPVRQPLARALIGAPGFAALPAELRDQVADELNVRVLEPLDAVGSELVSYAVRPGYRSLGRRFGKDTPLVAAAIEAADPASLATELRSAGSAGVRVAGVAGEAGSGLVRLRPEDVTITQMPRAGWAVAADGGETVALATVITPELRREGYARQVIRLVQEARKGDGLAVSDRIALHWATADPELARALDEHGALVSAEVLATSYGPATGSAAAAEDPAAGADDAGEGPAGSAGGAGESHEHADAELDLTFWIQRA